MYTNENNTLFVLYIPVRINGEFKTCTEEGAVNYFLSL